MRRGKVDLPKGLLLQPFFCGALRDLGSLGQLFDRGEAFPVAAGALVNRDLKQTLEAARWTSTGSEISRSRAN